MKAIRPQKPLFYQCIDPRAKYAPLIIWSLSETPEAEQHIWLAADGTEYYVREMKTSHIKNTMKCWEGKGKNGRKIPKGYNGGKEKWMKIFEQELINRQ